jgi:hypothetical protein
MELRRWFDVEIGEVHLAFGKDLDGENGVAGGELESSSVV